MAIGFGFDEVLAEGLKRIDELVPCSHGCGRFAPSGGVGDYCDPCHDDSCLVGPDGLCRYTLTEEEE